MIRVSLFKLSYVLGLGLLVTVNGASVAPDSLASSFALTTSTSLPFPSSTLSSTDTESHLTTEWSLAKNKLQDGESNLAFVQDPFPSSSSSAGPVLQVSYPSGSYSHDTGGAQFINVWDSAANFQSMMLTYEIAFPSGFDWVKGGKLPGLRGGNGTTGCSGGNQPTGAECFSARLMWRPNGAGEVYAYIPTPNNLCSDKSIQCNDDFGVSISRGSWTFNTGQWNRITMLVQLNNPADTANGQIQLYFNDVSVLSQQNLQLRSALNLTANGLYFSTFFGGSDTSWATPKDTATYFRNISMWASDQPSTLTGSKVQASSAVFLAIPFVWATVFTLGGVFWGLL